MRRGAPKLAALAAGGTGGHLFPAEALAQELKRRGWEILLVTDARGARYAGAFPADERFEISAKSPSVGGPIAQAFAAAALAGGLIAALRDFRRRELAVAVGFGGYPSFPAMKAAQMLRIPYGLHEQNGVLGRANRLLAGGAEFLAHAFPHLERAPPAARRVEVGNPVRDAVAAFADAPYAAPLADGPINLLVFGGSQGASLFSRVAPEAISGLSEALRRRLRIVQQAREGEVEGLRRTYAAAGVPAEVAPFFKDLPRRIAEAHIVVARAGASTVTEIGLIGRPAILVPLAIAMDDHQTGNAKSLSGAGAASLIPESSFDASALQAALEALLSDPSRLAAMAAAARGRLKSGAAPALADLVEAAAQGAKRAAA